MQEKWNWCMTGWLCGNVSSLMFSMMTESMLSITRGWRRKIKASHRARSLTGESIRG
jgi:hypothetical protein